MWKPASSLEDQKFDIILIIFQILALLNVKVNRREFPIHMKARSKLDVKNSEQVMLVKYILYWYLMDPLKGIPKFSSKTDNAVKMINLGKKTVRDVKIIYTHMVGFKG